MSILIKNLINSKFAENVQTSQYTATNAKCIIDKFTATNTSSSTIATISVHLVLSGGSASSSNLVSNSIKISPGESYLFPEITGHVIEVNGFISTIASASNTLVIRASGREIS